LTPEFEGLRQRVVEILSLDSQEPLDAAGLYRHLCDTGEAQAGLKTVLAEILSETTYMHAGFARPGRSQEQARQGWKSIWNNRLQEQLQADLQSARRRHAEEASDENWARIAALRGQIEALMRETDDANGQGTELAR